jgi:hypothetical protein
VCCAIVWPPFHDKTPFEMSLFDDNYVFPDGNAGNNDRFVMPQQQPPPPPPPPLFVLAGVDPLALSTMPTAPPELGAISEVERRMQEYVDDYAVLRTSTFLLSDGLCVCVCVCTGRVLVSKTASRHCVVS